jgi:ankyrin repeat protein
MSNKDELVGIQLINDGATNDYCDQLGNSTLHLACWHGKDKVAFF